MQSHIKLLISLPNFYQHCSNLVNYTFILMNNNKNDCNNYCKNITANHRLTWWARRSRSRPVDKTRQKIVASAPAHQTPCVTHTAHCVPPHRSWRWMPATNGRRARDLPSCPTLGARTCRACAEFGPALCCLAPAPLSFRIGGWPWARQQDSVCKGRLERDSAQLNCCWPWQRLLQRQRWPWRQCEWRRRRWRRPRLRLRLWLWLPHAQGKPVDDAHCAYASSAAWPTGTHCGWRCTRPSWRAMRLHSMINLGFICRLPF